jgi:hypothetical protein
MEPPEFNPFAPPDERAAYAYGPAPVAAPKPWDSPRAALVVGIVLALVAVTGLLTVLDRGQRDTRPEAVRQAECDAPRDFPVAEIEVGHSSGMVSYESDPPYGGPHAPQPLPGPIGYFGRSRSPVDVAERAVHNLEHGYVVVWYDAGATDKALQRVSRELFGVRDLKVLVVPWRGEVREDRHFTLAAWGHLQSCAQPTAEAIRAFYDEHGGPNGDAPEKLVG